MEKGQVNRTIDVVFLQKNFIILSMKEAEKQLKDKKLDDVKNLVFDFRFTEIEK